jgi:hypothetical protein
MALARIISRSPQCSRELALDLLTRGYTVEVVSPDAIPDNFADLELRVEGDASKQLTANVAVRTGDRSTSLDFVHHLKAPMVDFVRRPPETGEAVYFPDSPVSFNAEQGLFDVVELPPKTPERTLAPARQALRFLPDPEEAVPLITPPEQVLPPAQESEEHIRTGITIVFHRSRSKPKLKLKAKPANTSGGWFLRTAVGFAAVVVIAVVLGRGVRRDGGTSFAQNSPNEPPKTAPAEEASVFAVREPQHPTVSAAAETRVSGSQEEKRAAASQEPASPKSQSSPSNSRIESPLRKADDLRTPDAAAYRGKPIAKVAKNIRRHKSRSSHHDGLVATDTVTYLDRRVAPKSRLQ